MIELHLYQCETCGTQYKDKKECTKCEKSHIKPMKISGARYHAQKESNNYPDKVTITMADGHTIDYKR